MRTARPLRVLITFCIVMVSVHARAGRIVAGSSGQRYEMGRLIGKGGFGSVYKGWKLDGAKRGELVAIKQYESLATAINEDEALKGVAALSHLPHALGDGFDDKTGKNFLVSSWVMGRTLETWSKKRKPSMVERVRSVIGACDIVGKLHGHGWLHLDLKPQNIMIDGKQRVTLIDIGIAQRKDASGSAVASGDGTHEFMPPEQRAKHIVDDRADVFALAGTLYRLLVQHNPVAVTNEPGEVGTHLDEVEDLGLRAVLKKGMAPSAADRYASAAQLAAALRDWETAH